MGLGKFIGGVMREDTPQSFGRTSAVPFLFSAWLVGTIAGVQNALSRQSVLDDVLTLAGIAFSLYTGGKTLSILKGKNTEIRSAPEAKVE